MPTSYKIVPNINSAKSVANVAHALGNTAQAKANVAANLHSTRSFTANNNNTSIHISNTHLANVIHAFSGNVYITTNTAHRQGDFVRVYNDSNVNIVTITQNSGVTLHYHNTLSVLSNTFTGNRLLGPKGYVTVTCVNSHEYIVTGFGLK